MNFAVLKPFVLIIIFSFASVVLCQTAESSGWKKINADGLFSFRLPKGFKKTKMMGVENYLGEYYKGTTRFLFVCDDTNSYDVQSDSSVKDFQEIKTRIGDKPASIRTFSLIRDSKRVYRAELNFGDWENGYYELYMEVEGENQTDIEMAKQIFNSVIFAKQRSAQQINGRKGETATFLQ